MYDSKEEGAHDFLAAEINKYSRQHKLNIEGIFNPDYKADKKDTHNMFNKMTGKDFKVALSNDQISHFICRLAYCRNDELRKWFVLQETRLFYHRLASF